MNIPASFAIATARESQQIDSDTVQSFGIDEFTLMEVAGISAAKEIRKKTADGSHGVFLCGKGNNGGDALVVARYLVQQGIKCTVVFVGGSDDLAKTAQQNFKLLQKVYENDPDLTANFCHGWAEFDQNINPNFVIDGMLGTGLNSELRGDYLKATSWANDSSALIYAMDIPTGIHADTGKVMGKAVHASTTFAFGVLKQGFYLAAGPNHTGTVHYCELPFPAFTKSRCSSFLIDPSWMPEASSKPARHKYEAGIVYIIAGSEGLTGAAIMAAKSAWGEGVGAVILICPRGLLPAFEYNLPQIIKKPVGSKDDVIFRENHLKEVNKVVQKKPGVMLIGPGLGRNESTITFITQFLADYKQNCVIDADALWALSQIQDWNKPDSSSWIITPHPGELKTLLKQNIDDDFKRLEAVKKIAGEKKIFVLSKGFPVITGAPGGHTYLSDYDSRIFSRAGFGDVLAGKIAAFNARGDAPEISCFKALLAGQEKINRLKQNNTMYIPEPFDLI